MAIGKVVLVVFTLLFALVAWRLSVHLPPQPKHLCPQTRVADWKMERERLLKEMQVADKGTVDVGFFPSRSSFASDCSSSETDSSLSLFFRVWKDPKTVIPKAIVFFVHGFGEHTGRYDELANWLTNYNDVVVFALDHQGHGRSEGERAHVEFFQDYVEDVHQFVDRVLHLTKDEKEVTKDGQTGPRAAAKRLIDQIANTLNISPSEAIEKWQSTPRFLLGHSMGATITFLTASQRPGFWKSGGVIVSGIAFEGSKDLERWEGVATTIGQLFPKVALPILSIPPEGLSTLQNETALYASDPLVYHGALRIGWGSQITKAMGTLPQCAQRITDPLLLIHGLDDPICLASGVKTLHKVAASEHKSLIIYPSMLHEIFKEMGRTTVFEDVSNFIANPLQFVAKDQ